MGVTGVPQVQDGVDFGFTDFSEFAVAAGLPAGITAFGIGSESPAVEAIVNDVAEGNYFEMSTIGGAASWGYGLDAFNALLSDGELLARVYVNVNNARRGIGPAINLSGLVGQPSGSPDFDGEGGGVFLRSGVDIESAGSQNNNGSGSVPINGADFQEAFQNATWAWQRVRIIDAGGGNLDWEIKTWYGALADEPALLDGSAFGQGRVVDGAIPGALGWMQTQLGTTLEQRIAYLSFTSDPTKIPAPGPASEETPDPLDTPKPIISSPEIEYDARRLSSLGDGADVLTWVDSSPGGTNPAVETPPPDDIPTFRADRWAPGIPSVEFKDLNLFPPDSTEQMDYDATVWTGTELTLFIVAQVIDITEGAAFIGTRFGATPPREVDVCLFPDGTLFFGFGTETIPTAVQTNIITDAGVIKAGDKVIITVRSTGGAAGVSPEGMLIRLNGVQVASDPSFVTPPVATVQQGVLGRSQNTGSPELGLPGGTIFGKDRLIAWIGGYSAAVTNSEIEQMEAFLDEVFQVGAFAGTTFPDRPRPTTVGDLWGSGALKDVGPSGLIQLRATKAAGWSWSQTWGLLSVRNFVHMEMIAFLDKAWNRGQVFNVTHPLVPGSGIAPNGLGTGGVLVDGAAQAVDSTSIMTDGWPASTQDVARAGDAILIDGDSAVYIVTARVSSNGAGQAELPITPPLRKSPADDAIVTTTAVAFRVVMAERSQFENAVRPQYFSDYRAVFTEALL